MKVLFTAAWVLDCADLDEANDCALAMERGARNNIIANLDASGHSWSDIADRCEFYGITFSVEKTP